MLACRAPNADPSGSWPFGRVSENLDFRSEGPKNFPKALSHSIFRTDRKYGLGFVIRPREDREFLKLRFYPYRIGLLGAFLEPKLFGVLQYSPPWEHSSSNVE